MQIDLNREEAEIMLKALECWEKDASSNALLGTIFSALLCPKEMIEEEKENSKKEMEKASQEGRIRKIESISLQAKLLKALTSMPALTGQMSAQID